LCKENTEIFVTVVLSHL